MPPDKLYLETPEKLVDHLRAGKLRTTLETFAELAGSQLVIET